MSSGSILEIRLAGFVDTLWGILSTNCLLPERRMSKIEKWWVRPVWQSVSSLYCYQTIMIYRVVQKM